MIVLGIHYGHGSAAALIVNGQVLAAIEEDMSNQE
jgi:predicted NodU family carbamoyl transferase